MKNRVLLAIALLLWSSQVDAGQLSNNWGLKASNVPAAWALADGGKRIKVCVMDTGVDVTHPDLKDRICPSVRNGEYGWDFILNQPNPADEMGHGTHVAGIIRATSPSACIIPVRWHGRHASSDALAKNIVSSIYYCIKRGADVINYSGGGRVEAEGERKALEVATNHNIPVIVAAGNERLDLDVTPEYFPASYRLPNVIAVAAVNQSDELWSVSDWGLKTVQVAAPGVEILSTLPGGQYGRMSGTSMATPVVTGIVAMILSKHPSFTVADVRAVILKSVTKLRDLKGKVTSGGKVNAKKAMIYAKELALQKRNRKL